jgi:large subunit ribosomal protein L18
MDKKGARLRRARRTRAKIKELGFYRLTVHRTLQHIYAQVISPDNGVVVVSASTLDRELRGKLQHASNIQAAGVVGQLIAHRAIASGVSKVAFDRSGFKYHGRVQALADAAREGGLEF